MNITPFRRSYRIKTFGFRGSWGQIFRVEQGFRNIGCTIAEEGEDFDFIYSNALLPDQKTVDCKRATGKPLIWHVHDLPAFEGTAHQRSIEKLTVHRNITIATADQITVNTRFVARQLETYWGYQGAKVVGQPIQVDPDADGFRARPRRNLAVIIGRLNDPLKNTELALQALSRLRSPPDLAMIWAGKPKKKPHSFFRRHRIKHYCEIPANQLATVIKSAKMLLAPSLFEGLGLPPIEALALGTPCIVSDIPVKREVFDSTPVLFHDPNSAEDLARAIQQLLSNEELGWQMVERFASKVDFYTPDAHAANICTIYEDIRARQ
jgi:glycosyltransferase involved in cell wall biosynthesis